MVSTRTPAIDKAMGILSFLANTGKATFTQIQQTTELPKSTTSSLLASLLTHGLVNLEGGKYSLGLRWFEFGNKVEETLGIKSVAQAPLTRLRDLTSLTCHLGVLEGTAAIYVLKLESPTAIVIRSWVGRRLSLHSSGLGKALLAWLPDEQLEHVLPNIDFVKRTKTTITDVDVFRKDLATSHRRGWAFDNAEDNDGVYCISAPIFDSSGDIIAAISASGVSSQINAKNIPALATAVMDTAAEITRDYRQATP